jgi:hypothetical protein
MSKASGQKMLDWPGGTVLQKLFGVIRFTEKPESASGFRAILVIGGLELPAGKAKTTPCFPPIALPPPLPLNLGSLEIGVEFGEKNW